MISLGDKAKDIVTEFEGIVTAKASYLTGCDQYCLTPGLDKDGKPMESRWFDENRITVIMLSAVKIKTESSKGSPHGYGEIAPIK